MAEVSVQYSWSLCCFSDGRSVSQYLVRPAGDNDGIAVSQLRGGEGGGWKVSTVRSHYIFDLDQMTVTRHRGANASATINDQTRRIDTIVACEVGRGGFWTMKPEGDMAIILEDYWQASTGIRTIERIGS